MEETRLSKVLDEFQRRGLYGFNRSQIQQTLHTSPAAVAKSINRLAAGGRIKRLRKDFHLIIPVEYSVHQTLPVDWFIDDLMRSLDLPYYLGLLSAAALYGAAHQQAQQTQIIVPRQERPLQAQGLSIRFFRKQHFEATPLQFHKGHAGLFPVSSPEATALDLVRYARQIGGLDAVLTVLTELTEAMAPEGLVLAAAAESEAAYAQRLGWLLDSLKQSLLADALHSALTAGKSLPRTRLDPSVSWEGSSASNRWHIVENAEPQSDL